LAYLNIIIKSLLLTPYKYGVILSEQTLTNGFKRNLVTLNLEKEMEKAEHEQWEYDVTVMPDEQKTENILNKIGDKGEGGWELVAVTALNSWLKLFWKRKKLIP
jgi:hypothetical protein